LVQKLVAGALLDLGRGVIDYGVISTPALFRESRVKGRAAVMVTASHNEPEWNGLKFVLGGRVPDQAEFDRIMKAKKRVTPIGLGGQVRPGPRPSYVRELVEMAGEGSCDGLKVAVDLNGGAAIAAAPAIFKGLGCELVAIGGTPGIFSRTIDPTNDELKLLSRTVKEGGCDVGFAFDCDGDRLVLVDGEGRPRTGDFMLTLALMETLPSLADKSVVVSADTTQAVDEVVSEQGGRTFRSKVGEANVIAKMTEAHAQVGGEGSSGGFIDGRYNSCRDSMLAAVTIAKAMKLKGKKVLENVPSYHQVRLKASIERKKALAGIRRLERQSPGADTLDGVKISPSKRSWVLIRPSGTEDIVRVSSESTTARDARELAESYLEELKRLSG
jgi:phosphomannomutase